MQLLFVILSRGNLTAKFLQSDIRPLTPLWWSGTLQESEYTETHYKNLNKQIENFCLTIHNNFSTSVHISKIQRMDFVCKQENARYRSKKLCGILSVSVEVGATKNLIGIFLNHTRIRLIVI